MWIAHPFSVFATTVEQLRKSRFFDRGIVWDRMVGVYLPIKNVVDGVMIAVTHHKNCDLPRVIVWGTARSWVLVELIPCLEFHIHYV